MGHGPPQTAQPFPPVQQLGGLLLAACGAKDKASYNVYRELRPGMTLKEVDLRFGHAGRLLASKGDIEGRLLPKLGETTYIWINRDGVQDDAVL